VNVNWRVADDTVLNICDFQLFFILDNRILAVRSVSEVGQAPVSGNGSNVILNLNLLTRLRIYKLLMSIKIKIRGPSPRCLFPWREPFVYSSGSLPQSTIALRVEILPIDWSLCTIDRANVSVSGHVAADAVMVFHETIHFNVTKTYTVFTPVSWMSHYSKFRVCVCVRVCMCVCLCVCDTSRFAWAAVCVWLQFLPCQGNTRQKWCRNLSRLQGLSSVSNPCLVNYSQKGIVVVFCVSHRNSTIALCVEILSDCVSERLCMCLCMCMCLYLYLCLCLCLGVSVRVSVHVGVREREGMCVCVRVCMCVCVCARVWERDRVQAISQSLTTATSLLQRVLKRDWSQYSHTNPLLFCQERFIANTQRDLLLLPKETYN